MEKLNIKFIAAVVVLMSIMTATIANAAPVRFKQVTQVVNVKPGKASNGNFARLRLTGDNGSAANGENGDGDGDDKKKSEGEPQQDDRVITETTSEIVEDEVCDCVEPVVAKGGFPKWALLGLGAIPLLFLLKDDDDKTPTPTPSGSPSGSPTGTPSMTPSVTPSVTPSMTPSETPSVTPTPEEPVPEPMTLLLFGTGLAGIGMAARRKFGRKEEEENEDSE